VDIVLLAERLPRAPWLAGHLVHGVAIQLAARGHRVTLCAEAVEDPTELLAAGVTLRTRAPFCHRRRHVGGPYYRWIRRELHAAPTPAVASFSRLVIAPVWAPLSGSAFREAGRALARFAPHGPVCTEAAFADAKAAPALLWRGILELLARSHGERLGRLRRAVVFGGLAREDLARAVGLPAHVIADATAAGAAPAPPPPAVRAADAELARRLLALPPHRTLILLSLSWRVDARVPSLFAGLHHARRTLGDNAPLLAVVSPDPFAVLRLAAQAGVADLVIPVAPTSDYTALLAAADAVAVAGPMIAPRLLPAIRAPRPIPLQEPGPEHVAASNGPLGTPARATADALLWSKPLLLARGAPGDWMLTGPGAAAGALVAADQPHSWADAFSLAASPDWRASAARAARALVDVLHPTVDAFVDRLESELALAARDPAA
jgi:hypothetical protein